MRCSPQWTATSTTTAALNPGTAEKDLPMALAKGSHAGMVAVDC